MMLSALLAASCSGDCCRMAVVKLAAAASGMTAVYTQMLESDLQHQVTALQQVADLSCTCSFRCLGYIHNGLCRQSICIKH